MARGVGVIANIAGRSVSARVVRLSHVPVTLVKPENTPASSKALLQHDAA
jgi:hypothetical protein